MSRIGLSPLDQGFSIVFFDVNSGRLLQSRPRITDANTFEFISGSRDRVEDRLVQRLFVYSSRLRINDVSCSFPNHSKRLYRFPKFYLFAKCHIIFSRSLTEIVTLLSARVPLTRRRPMVGEQRLSTAAGCRYFFHRPRVRRRKHDRLRSRETLKGKIRFSKITVFDEPHQSAS